MRFPPGDAENPPAHPEIEPPIDPIDKIFDDEIVEIFLVLPDESTQSLIDQSSQAQSQGVEGFDWEYVPANFIFDGVEFENVGIRLKGQGSFQPFWVKPSMKVVGESSLSVFASST